MAAQYWPNWTPTAFFWPLNVAKRKLEQAESLPDDLLDSTACVSWGVPEAPRRSANALKQEFALKILAGKMKKQTIPGEDRKKVMNEDLESFEINTSPDKALCDVWVWRLAVWKINWIFFVCLSPPPLKKGKSFLPSDPQSTALPSRRRAAAALPIGKCKQECEVERSKLSNTVAVSPSLVTIKIDKNFVNSGGEVTDRPWSVFPRSTYS